MFTAPQKELIDFLGVKPGKAPPQVQVELNRVLDAVKDLSETDPRFVEFTDGLASVAETVHRQYKKAGGQNLTPDEAMVVMSTRMVEWFLYWARKHFGLEMPNYTAELKRLFNMEPQLTRTGP